VRRSFPRSPQKVNEDGVDRHNAFRGGAVHVCEQLCDSCVFRPGNLMYLEPGCLAGMVADAKANESAIICHSTLYRERVDNAVCRGFFDRHPTQPLQVAERLGLVLFDRVPQDPTSGGVPTSD
jgi:hypothetical protein